MLKEKIESLRVELDSLIENNAPYEQIYKISRELDKYISEYYREEESKK